ncbi:threonine-phosphate decarboxylase CobD [Peptacetobacter sp.]|uniref:threonine-phosphate decarboxylase CobD n=1 Tax=Peptacetobacter sp. TaxID=2991975 RepID=UPI002E77EA7A|nr:threonine-phosphate decarboxylase CobD [Peptacetobacter sp.]MEE0452318.1 threonine-phosphate decarboxylase CobD [Peptacetobacter sp.]
MENNFSKKNKSTKEKEFKKEKVNINSVHGADINSAAKLYGLEADKIIDFSSNINPFIVESMDKIVAAGVENLQKYPDIKYRRLRKNIADYLRVEDSYIIPGNGATEIIYLLMRNLSGRLAIINPTFSEYRKGAEIAGLSVVDFVMDWKKDFKLDLDEIYRRKDEFDSIFICNPNNPDGSVREIKKLLEFAEKEGKLLIVDETFIEFADSEKDRSLVNMVEKSKNLFIIRAVTKFFGIPGIRLGYGISSNRELLQKMYDEKEPWTINSFADSASDFIFKDDEYIRKSKEYFSKERICMINEINKIDGIKAFNSDANFILVRFENRNVLDVKENLLKRAGLLIRDASNFIGLDSSFARVAIKNHEQNTVLVDALRSVLGE